MSPRSPLQNPVSEARAADFLVNKYLVLRNILPTDLLEYLKVYYRVLKDNGDFVRDWQCPSSLSLYGDAALDAVLEWLRPRISGLIGTPLVSTYSYTRIYSKGEMLQRHTDRGASEIALTICISIPEGGAPSTLFLCPPGAAKLNVEMLEGDGCLYAGTEVEHWREEFSHDGYIQLFLFFITPDGRFFPEHELDGRKRLGDRRGQSVLTVNGVGTSIRSLVSQIEELQKADASLTEGLVDRMMIDAAVNEQPPSVSEAEVEEMVEEFRIGRHLFSGEATQRWLDDTGITLRDLRALMRHRLRVRKFRETIVAGRARPYFDTHKQDFDVLTVFRLETSSRSNARILAETARNFGLWEALNAEPVRVAQGTGFREIRYRLDLPGYEKALVHEVIGPNQSPTGVWVGEVLDRRPARFDAPTRARIERLLFAEWLSERRQMAKVEWHWA